MDAAFSRAADHNEVAACDNHVNPEVAFSLCSFGKDESSEVASSVDVCSSNGWLVCI